ncbi:MAG: endonuclease [Proteobacteria bacterium]|nr:endonuclease [Pseudomonadota bacterium]
MFRLFLIMIFLVFSSCTPDGSYQEENARDSNSKPNLIKAIKPTSPVTSFSLAKKKARDEVYYDNKKTFYCGCDFTPTTTSGASLNPENCGYKPKRNNNRSKRIEWEHVVPAYEIYKNLSCNIDGHPKCVKNGRTFKGRKCCAKVDKGFEHAEADLHNLTPAVGELNGDRSNYRFNEIAGEEREYGSCDFEVKDQIAEPKEILRGDVARIWLYMIDAYNLDIEDEYIEMLKSWHISDPVSNWEIKRDKRIMKIQGNYNPYLY